MLNINDLENRWLSYKIKSYIPHALIVISIFVIVIIIFVVMNSKADKTPITDTPAKKIEKVELKQSPAAAYTKESAADSTNDTSNKKPQQDSEKVAIIEKSNAEKVESEKVVISPSLDFMKKIESDAKKEAVKKPINNPLPKKKEIVSEPVAVEKKTEAAPVVKEEEQKKVIINIGKEDNQKEIQDVIDRFKKTNSPVLSLFIAKKYYEAGDYTMAYNYALITNGIDSEIEPSWLIFAKSMVKLNQKEKAIKTLKEYIDHSNSSRAKTLLDEIISGKMK